MKQIVTSFCALVCLAAGLFAQNITVTDAIGQSPVAFLKNNLISGDGVYLFNVKYNNSASNIDYRAVGTFDAGTYDGLGMQKGIIMTSGDIDAAVGPNTSGSFTMQLYPTYTDQTISSLATGTVNGSSSFDFDFVCLNSNISFNYCFGSEEYVEFCCQQVNDLFVFLLTGPDPETGEEVAKNIAMIPNTISDDYPNGIPVSVNSVNDGLHGNDGVNDCFSGYSSYFIHNEPDDGSQPDGVQYDGFTDKLTARASVVPCAVYHMHIAIANVSDNAWDSGVFLEGGSFAAPSAETGLSVPTTDTVKGSCPFSRTIDLTAADFESGTVHFKYGGTATYGVDYILMDEYENEIDTNSFELTKEPRSFTIKGLPTANLKNDKSIELYLETQFCAEFPQLIVHDTQHYAMIRGGDVKLADTTIECADGCFEVAANLIYGENVTYQWLNLDGTVATGIANPYAGKSTAMIFEDRDYIVIATGGSGCNSDTATVHVKVKTKEIPVGIDEVDAAIVNVYPNPATEVINIEAEGLQRVEVYTVEGRLVMDREYNNVNGSVAISTDELEAGVYGIRVSTANGKRAAKVVVNK